jgi:quinol monooxygenase YgiN
MRILSIIQIAPIPEKRAEILQILCSIKEPVQAISACLDCRVCQEEGGEGLIVYLEQWQSWEAFMRHLRSETYAKILEAIELSREMPNVTFFEVSSVKGMDLLKAVRSEKVSD